MWISHWLSFLTRWIRVVHVLRSAILVIIILICLRCTSFVHFVLVALHSKAYIIVGSFIILVKKSIPICIGVGSWSHRCNHFFINVSLLVYFLWRLIILRYLLSVPQQIQRRYLLTLSWPALALRSWSWSYC
jgi:hypothetical protein